jgi:hypothetical protein
VAVVSDGERFAAFDALEVDGTILAQLAHADDASVDSGARRSTNQ